MRSTFTLTENEQKSAEAFEEAHRHFDIDHGCIGGHLTYSFNVTSIGLGVTVACGDCNTEEDITDYDSW